MREPHREVGIFCDSSSSLNSGLEIQAEPGSDCYFKYFVLQKHREVEPACYYAPLNMQEDIPASQDAAGGSPRLQDEFCS